MKRRLWNKLVLIAVAAVFHAIPAYATPYYVFAPGNIYGQGDAIEYDNGVQVRFIATHLDGSVAAGITDSIWLRDATSNSATQFTLDLARTGATSPATSASPQILDGTSDGVHNYGVSCCIEQNRVIVANLDWSNEHPLFDLPSSGDDFGLPVEGRGIAFDTASNSLYVSLDSATVDGPHLYEVYHYSLDGAVLDKFSFPTEIRGLAYEQSTNTLWGFAQIVSSEIYIYQVSLSGTVLNRYDVECYFNCLGGEMPIKAVEAVPEPAAWILMLVGFGSLGAVLRRRPAAVIV